MTTIGERIVYMRDEREISQKELAARLQITAATLSRYENNIYEPKVEVLKDMCVILETTSDFLLGFTPSFEIPDAKRRSQITPQEARVLKYFRKLNEGNQIRVMERIDTLLEMQDRKEA